jgi:hypothetical protein
MFHPYKMDVGKMGSQYIIYWLRTSCAVEYSLRVESVRIALEERVAILNLFRSKVLHLEEAG